MPIFYGYWSMVLFVCLNSNWIGSQSITMSSILLQEWSLSLFSTLPFGFYHFCAWCLLEFENVLFIFSFLLSICLSHNYCCVLIKVLVNTCLRVSRKWGWGDKPLCTAKSELLVQFCLHVGHGFFSENAILIDLKAMWVYSSVVAPKVASFLCLKPALFWLE